MTETYSALDEEKKEKVDVALDELIKEGFVTDDRGKHYPIVRHSNAYSKDNEKLIGEIEQAGLTASELTTVLQSYQEYPLFFDGYELNENNTEYFISRYGVDFKFDKYDYVLEASFDNRK